VQSGKDSRLRLINLANLSGLGGPGHLMGDPSTLQVGSIVNLLQGGTVLSQPAVWVNPADGTTWVFVVNNNGSAAYKLVFDGSGNPSLVLQWNNGTGGTSPLIANNVLFSVGGNTLRARDPVNGNALWSSSAASIGTARSWPTARCMSPMVRRTCCGSRSRASIRRRPR